MGQGAPLDPDPVGGHRHRIELRPRRGLPPGRRGDAPHPFHHAGAPAAGERRGYRARARARSDRARAGSPARLQRHRPRRRRPADLRGGHRGHAGRRQRPRPHRAGAARARHRDPDHRRRARGGVRPARRDLRAAGGERRVLRRRRRQHAGHPLPRPPAGAGLELPPGLAAAERRLPRQRPAHPRARSAPCATTCATSSPPSARSCWGRERCWSAPGARCATWRRSTAASASTRSRASTDTRSSSRGWPRSWRCSPSRKLKRRDEVAGLSGERGDSIVGGGLAIDVLASAVGAPEVLVSGQGVREGLVQSLFEPEAPSVEAVRSASLRSLTGALRGLGRAVGAAASRGGGRAGQCRSGCAATARGGRRARPRRPASWTSAAASTSSTATNTPPASSSPPRSSASRTARSRSPRPSSPPPATRTRSARRCRPSCRRTTAPRSRPRE